MLSIDSDMWSVRSYNGIHIQIINRASGRSRMVSRSALPDTYTLSMVTAARFNALCREAFENAV